MKNLMTLALLASSRVLGSDVINVGPFVDTDQCYSALHTADANGDGRIDGDEYVTVNQLLGPVGFLANTSQFQDLPLIIQGTFNLLACRCAEAPNATTDCCIGDNASLSNNGTAPGDTPTNEQTTYLFTVCLQTHEAISITLQTDVPTFSPSISPSILTTAPSNAATQIPTSKPTILGSVVPSSVISTLPSGRVTTAPSNVISTFPSGTITTAPSGVISTLPSGTITAAPSDVISTFPSGTITTAPSGTITTAPSATASTVPTTTEASPFPSMANSSISPTTTVTGAPIETLVPSMNAPATLAPMMMPSMMPSTIVDSPVQVTYLIEIKGGNALTSQPFVDDLRKAMDLLARQVADDTFPGSRNLRRRLKVSIDLPTAVVGRLNQTCPRETSTAENCEEIIASVTLILSNVENTMTVKEKYKTALDEAIAKGRLQGTLNVVNINSSVRILSGAPLISSPPTSSPAGVGGPIGGGGGLNGGVIGGIVVAALTVLAVGIFAIARRQRREKAEGAYFPGSNQQALQQTDDYGTPPGGDVLGATTPDYGKKSKKSSKVLEADQDTDIDAAPEPLLLNESHDSSSNAGDSGWSSSAGVSSLRSGSFESMDGETRQPGSTLANIGAASALATIATTRDRGSEGAVPDLPAVTRDDLDSAIEAGDWAAVGATAALLAAASDSQSYSSRSRRSGTSVSRGGSSMSSMDAARAAVLDHLVDAGDWEGVVLAAAKFEATEDSSSKASQTGGSATGSSQFSGTASQGYSPSTSVSESPSKVQKRDEIREEVEALVRRVVPEEIGNVDEMMMQFKGREEELVETLRTMQERQVAQKARVQGQKQAKRDAKLMVAAGGAGLPATASSATSGGIAAPNGATLSTGTAVGIAIGTAAAAGVAAGLVAGNREKEEEVSSYSHLKAAKDSDSLGFESGGDSDYSNTQRRTALELAIEAGDWEAVGEAAAMMSDTSVTSVSTAEIDRIGTMSGGSSKSSFSDESADRRRRMKSGINAERAAELDQMIDSGDWTGVVAAAGRFSSERTPSIRSGGGSAQSNRISETETSGSSGQRDREHQLKEEEDALAQAEIWMAIAEQSKQEGQTDAGASDAADWAIARSLSALKKAEKTGELQRMSAPSDVSEAASVASSQDRSV